MDAESNQRRRLPEWLIGVALAALTFVLFGRSVQFEFLTYDDQLFIRDNPYVRNGLSLGDIRWAFRPDSTVAGNWHPVTVISHMADCQLFGFDPAGHHAVNVLLHAVNTLLLFWVLTRMTNDVWPAAFVAALFSWHPLHVESVAWIAERKDVLSTCFWFAALLAYGHYVRRPTWSRYGLVAMFFVLGLLSKPMVVTLPGTLLLLDWWPLRRFSLTRSASQNDAERVDAQPARTRWLFLEKGPLFAASIAFSAATVIWQDHAGALARTPLSESWKNAAYSYWAYLGKTIWPMDLAVLYPLRARHVTVGQAIIAVALLLAVCALAVYWARRRPYFAFGWFWYLGTMLPVVGLVQVGAQSMADRYTYVPLVGIFTIAGFGAAELVARFRWLRYPVAGAAGVWLVVLAVVMWNQLGYWRDTMRLFRHAIEVTDQNFYAHYMVGNQYIERGEIDKAIAELDKALAIKKNFHEAHHNKAAALLVQRRNLDKAVEHLKAALLYGHDPAKTKAKLAECLARLGRLEEAEPYYVASLTANPNQTATILGLGTLYTKQKRYAEAINLYRLALNSRGREPGIAARLAWLEATCPDAAYRNGPEAVALAEEACRAAEFRSVRFRDVLAAAYAEVGRFDAAIEQATTALRMIRSVESNNRWTDTLEEGISERIAEYQFGKPYRSTPADASWDDTMVF